MIKERPWDRKEFWDWYNRVANKYPISCRECKEERWKKQQQ